MNTAERIYRSVQNLPEVQAEEVLRFIDFLRYKQTTSTVQTTEKNDLRQLLKNYPTRNRSSVEIDGQIQSLRNQWE
ncbi:MAG: DUF2281 domain-containing protein [Methyloglobulus sp.]|nr:DUF2281 domain-containing protein [Methyloglobulus sp.]